MTHNTVLKLVLEMGIACSEYHDAPGNKARPIGALAYFVGGFGVFGAGEGDCAGAVDVVFAGTADGPAAGAAGADFVAAEVEGAGAGCGAGLVAGADCCVAEGVFGTGFEAGVWLGAAGAPGAVTDPVAGAFAGGGVCGLSADAGSVVSGAESAAAGSRCVPEAIVRSGTTVTGMFSVCTVPGSSRSFR